VHEQHPLLKVPQKCGAGTAVLAAAALALGLLAGCAASLPAPSVPVRDVAGDLVPEGDGQAAVLAGKLDRAGQRLHSWKELAPALRASRAHIAGREPGQVAVAHGDVAVTWGDLARTLYCLEALLPRLDAEPGLLAERFRWVKLKDGAAFSGYYEPVVKASRTRKPGYTAPLYRVPPDLRELNLGGFKSELIGQRIVYRMEKGRPVPYYTRAEIDGLDGRPGVLRGKGLELAWLSDPVDAFFLQVQGSGRLRFEDGSVRPVLYAGQNGHKYVALGRVMVDRGLLQREEVSMFSIREWLAAHPDQVRELLDTNPSYVFFRLGKPGTSGSKGSMGRRITPWVSVATDQSVLPNGLLTLMNVTLPDEGGEHSVPFNALTLPQDTGGAIKRNRVDLFCGNGETATHTASYLDNRGAVFLLLPR